MNSILNAPSRPNKSCLKVNIALKGSDSRNGMRNAMTLKKLIYAPIRKTGRQFIAAAMLLSLTSCANEMVESKFSNYRASFTFSPVTSVPPLQGALNGFGEYCAIWADANYYHFSSLTSTAQVNRTALSVYQTYICIGGFIVGRSALNDIGSAEYPVVCYDRACPNCWSSDNIAKAMRIEENGHAVCDRCHRTYDMNNEGLIVEGDKGRKLIRYRVSYVSNTLAINN